MPHYHYKTVYGLIVFMSAIWCGLLIIPLFFAEGNPLQQKIAGFITLFFAPICHQNPARSFFIKGHQAIVCARCTGLYFGFFFGSILYPFFKELQNTHFPSKWLLASALTTSILEYFLAKTALIYPRLPIRAAAGFGSGAIITFFTIPALIDFSHLIMNKIRKRQWNKLPAS